MILRFRTPYSEFVIDNELFLSNKSGMHIVLLPACVVGYRVFEVGEFDSEVLSALGFTGNFREDTHSNTLL